MTYQSDFILDALHKLQSRAEAAAKQHPGLRHMLVLPPGESIRVPSGSGPRPLGSGSRKQQPSARKFGETELVGPLPPRTSWPKGAEPVRAVVAGRSFVPGRANVLEPYRIHLFFGGSAGAFKRLQALADAVDGIRGDVTRALREDHSPFSDGVFYIDGDILHGVRAERLDSWLCTVHWWAWVWTECPYRTRPLVVYAGRTYETDPRDDAQKSKLVFSMFDADVLSASAEMLSLILRSLEERPAPLGLADYPWFPKADETPPADVATLGEQTKISLQRDVIQLRQANAAPSPLAERAPSGAEARVSAAGAVDGADPDHDRDNEIRDSEAGQSRLRATASIEGSHVLQNKETRPKKSFAKPVDWNALTDRQRNCMRALLELKAFDADSRQRAEDIALRAEGRGAKVNGFKEPLADLALRGMVASKTGREGGYWLAGRGRELLAVADAEWAADHRST